MNVVRRQKLTEFRVYRVLSQLEEAGHLRRTQFDAHSAVFELNDKGHHDHLVCTYCGCVKESTDPAVAQLMPKVASHHQFTLNWYALVLYGNCGCQTAVAWQTSNMDRLKARCRAFIAIESEPAALEKSREQGEKMTRAFGLVFPGMASEAQAIAHAHQLLPQRRLEHAKRWQRLISPPALAA